MAENSIIYRSAIGGKIGTSKLDIFDIKNHLREKKLVPGPGTYAAFSDFNQTIEWNLLEKFSKGSSSYICWSWKFVSLINDFKANKYFNLNNKPTIKKNWNFVFLKFW